MTASSGQNNLLLMSYSTIEEMEDKACERCPLEVIPEHIHKYQDDIVSVNRKWVKCLTNLDTLKKLKTNKPAIDENYWIGIEMTILLSLSPTAVVLWWNFSTSQKWFY